MDVSKFEFFQMNYSWRYGYESSEDSLTIFNDGKVEYQHWDALLDDFNKKKYIDLDYSFEDLQTIYEELLKPPVEDFEPLQFCDIQEVYQKFLQSSEWNEMNEKYFRESINASRKDKLIKYLKEKKNLQDIMRIDTKKVALLEIASFMIRFFSFDGQIVAKNMLGCSFCPKWSIEHYDKEEQMVRHEETFNYSLTKKLQKFTMAFENPPPIGSNGLYPTVLDEDFELWSKMISENVIYHAVKVLFPELICDHEKKPKFFLIDQLTPELNKQQYNGYHRN